MARRLKAAERKASILAVAKVLFADKGYHGVSVDEIASRLGVSPAVLYRHFSSKEALYEAVLNEIACHREDYMPAVLQDTGDFGSFLRRMTRVYVSSVARDPDYLRMELLSVLEGGPAERQFFENRWKPFSDYIEFGLRELAREREGTMPVIDGKVASLLFQGMIREALVAKCISKVEPYREFELDELVDKLVGLFFRAVGYQETSDAT